MLLITVGINIMLSCGKEYLPGGTVGYPAQPGLPGGTVGYPAQLGLIFFSVILSVGMG